ncbi:GNAT family N-acetyltransferase [Phycicoccus sp. CSK15P-2]|uniref:GNAT family N-acetyltransferase n=1 Tax=Phycicoccus sp. CSK15P-2 TaxID=2807627 RepID=UPI00194F04BA|nr:GNAT family N-acetyltransferase [Phycicoccus sp. CSK15P-2]MBM6403720.1 GNAT family N-acetyltransferase [Phycicoccus sp. CSK15P-2]
MSTAGGVTVRRVRTLEDLSGLTDRHPVVELDIGRGFTGDGWAAESAAGRAVVVPRRSDHGIRGAATLGDAAHLDALWSSPEVRSWFLDGPFQHLSAPREHQPVVARYLDLGERGGDWDWMWTRTAPPHVPGEERVVVLEPSDREELTAFLAEHSPRTHGQPFARPGQLWAGVRDDDGGLLACGASEPSEAGTPTLAGIAVDTGRRRTGLGAALTAALTRRAVDEVGACALGMFADNDAARRIYHRLGFTTAMEWRSRWLPSSTPPRNSA